MTNDRAICQVCWRHCAVADGAVGFCGARGNRGGKIVPLNYGKITSIGLDPIEKKPLSRFHPGSLILSVGSFGCNMDCPFCQNYQISRSPYAASRVLELVPEELVRQAVALKRNGNIGIAFTYNEPLTGYEYIRDTAKLAREFGLETVVVTNGQIEPDPLAELLPLITAWNIDLKAFTKEGYRKLGGKLDATLATIERAVPVSHVEVTTLVVPGLSDGEDDMGREAAWLASLDPAIPLHLSRYFPQRNATEPPTPIATLRRLKAVAEEHLEDVILGNV